MKRRALIAHLQSHGCRLDFNPRTRLHSAVPRHREVVEMLARKICRELGVPPP